MRFMSLSVVPTMRCADLRERHDDRCAACCGAGVVRRTTGRPVCEPCMVPGRACVRHAERCGRAIPGSAETAAVFPMQIVDNGGGFGSLTTLYTCLYRPLIAAAVGDVLRGIRSGVPHPRADAHRRIARGLAASRGLHRGSARCRGWRFASSLISATGTKPVAGHSWITYLAERPGTLRETIRRKLRRNPPDSNSSPVAIDWKPASRILNRSTDEAGRNRNPSRTSTRR